MRTERLYMENKYIRSAKAIVLETYPRETSEDIKGPSYTANDSSCDDTNLSEKLLLVLDRTIFFPGGGGQTCDLGTISGFPVLSVYEKDGVIYHLIDLPSDRSVSPGDECEMEIDWSRRFDNMQRHCGEHILSGVFYSMYGGTNRGFHMGDDHMTIDISLEDERKVETIDLEMALAAERTANEIIWQDLPVTTQHFATREEASGIATRKPVTIEEDITIVTIGDTSTPADSVACCGTHPSTSGQVGLIKIYKVEPNKGMFRIFFDAGNRALANYDREYDILTYMGKDLSAGTDDLVSKYEARKSRNIEVRDRLHKLTQEVIRRERESIVKQGTKQVYEYEILTIDDVIDLGRSLQGEISDILFLFHTPTLTLFLFSDSEEYDCGKIVKENAAVFGGKGGGNKNFSRAIFSRREDADMFIDAIYKMYQF